MSPRKKPALREKSFRALIENAHEGIALYDTTGVIVFASKSVKRVIGFTEESILGKKGTDFLHPDDQEYAREVFREVLRKPGKSVTFIQRIKHQKGHYIWAESRLTNFTRVPEINGIVSNFRDITARKQAEEKAEQTSRLLETINHNLTEGVYMGIIDQEILYVNQAYVRMFGYSEKEIKQLGTAVLYSDSNQRKKIVKKLRKQKALKGEEILFRKKNGKTFWGVLHVSLLRQGGEDYYIGTIRDISTEKAATAALLESRTFLNNIINTVAAPLFVKDEKHRWIIFNEKFAALAGRPVRDLIGKTDTDFVSREEARVFWKTDNEVLRTGKTVRNQERLTAADGRVHDLLTVKSRFVNESGKKFIIGFSTDITEAKKSEERIHQLNANLKGILESTHESVYAIDSQYRYLAFNENHKRIMKALYKANIEVGKNKINYFRSTRDARWVKTEIDRALLGNHFVSEHYLEHKGFTGYIQTTYNPIRGNKGQVRGVAVFVNDITPRKQFEEIIKTSNANLRALLESTTDHILAVDRKFNYITFNAAHKEGFRQLFKAEIKGGKSFLKALTPQLKVIAKREIGKALRGEQFTIEEQLVKESVFEVSLNPIRSDNREISGVAIFARDVTQRKVIEAKLKLLNDELVNQNAQLALREAELKAALEELSERNFELDQLMYKTSHDLRSPLSSIMGLVNLANLDEETANFKHYLSKIEGRIKKLDEFISSMLNYARVNRTDVVFEQVNLKQVAEASIKELEYLENFRSMNTKVECVGSSSVVFTDPLRIRIIFSNIISNAYKYYNPEEESRLNIQIRHQANRVEIVFQDNGIGIKPEHREKIFNMFYRATERSQGSGLGMYIVKQAVEMLNGNIRLASNYGKGTTITIILPVTEKVKT